MRPTAKWIGTLLACENRKRDASLEGVSGSEVQSLNQSMLILVGLTVENFPNLPELAKHRKSLIHKVLTKCLSQTQFKRLENNARNEPSITPWPAIPVAVNSQGPECFVSSHCISICISAVRTKGGRHHLSIPISIPMKAKSKGVRADQRRKREASGQVKFVLGIHRWKIDRLRVHFHFHETKDRVLLIKKNIEKT